MGSFDIDFTATGNRATENTEDLKYLLKLRHGRRQGGVMLYPLYSGISLQW